jgi:hypothetical protein
VGVVDYVVFVDSYFLAPTPLDDGEDASAIMRATTPAQQRQRRRFFPPKEASDQLLLSISAEVFGKKEMK